MHQCEHFLQLRAYARVVFFLLKTAALMFPWILGGKHRLRVHRNVKKSAHSYIVMCLDLALNKKISSLLVSDMFSLCNLSDLTSRLGRFFFRDITAQGTHDQICWHDDGGSTLSHSRAFTTTTPAPFRDIRWVDICRWYTCTHMFPGTADG